MVLSVYTASPRHRAMAAVVCRVIVALLGGYVVSTLGAVALSWLLPGTQADSVLAGMLASYAIYAAVVMWVFAAKTAAQACWSVLVTCLVLGAAVAATKVLGA